MRSGRTLRRGFGAALLGLGAAAAAWGQATAPPPPRFSGSTQVLSIEVPVQVTRDGEPVRGLQAGDFQVWEGRRKLPVTGFETLDLTAGPAVSVAGRSPATVPAAGRRHFLFLFDLAFSSPKSVARARQAATRLLAQLHPADLVAVATYSALRGPQLVLGYTADRRQIDTAITSLGLPDLSQPVDPLRLVLREILGAGNTLSPTGRPLAHDALGDALDMATLAPMEDLSRGIERADRSALKAQVETFARALSDLARQISRVEGRKYLVFLSEGFDVQLLEGTSDPVRQDAMREEILRGEPWRVPSEERYGLTETSNALERMLEELRRADCTLEAVDIGGVRAGETPGEPRVNGRDSLLMMAHGTGGDLYESFNDLGEAIRQMLQRTSVTYVLAVEPERTGPDGEYHRLRVELTRPVRGARLVHRPGYYPPKPYAEEAPIEKLLAAANQVMSGEESEAIGTAVLAVPFQAGEKAYVPVLIAVDGASLLAGTQPPTLPVEIYAYALDGEGAVHDFFTQTVGLDLTKAGSSVRQSGLELFGHLDLLPGDYSLRVLVRNAASGVSGLKVVSVQVPAFAPGEAVLLPPLVPAPAGQALLVRQETGGASPANPFLLRDQPFVPAVKPQLEPGREVRLVLAGYNLGSTPWKGTATVVAADGREIPGGPLAISGRLDGGAGKPDRAVATLRLPGGLAPGDYQLRITLAGAAPRTSALRFSVPRNPSGGTGR